MISFSKVLSSFSKCAQCSTISHHQNKPQKATAAIFLLILVITNSG